MKEFMRRHGLTSPRGYLAAFGAAVFIALSAACGSSSVPEPNADPREGRVYYDDTAEGEVVVVDKSTKDYIYFDVCNEDGELLRFYSNDAAETFPNHSACQPDPTSESTELSSPTD